MPRIEQDPIPVCRGTEIKDKTQGDVLSELELVGTCKKDAHYCHEKKPLSLGLCVLATVGS